MCTAFDPKSGDVLLYDSMWGLDKEDIPSTVELQICQIFGRSRIPTINTIHIRKVAVQQQLPGTLDCGLFAVAYATDICFGKDPKKSKFNQARMKFHLKDCLEREVMQPFPQQMKKVSRPPADVHMEVELYCLCRMPEIYDSYMVQCDECQKWFHKTCVVMSGKAIKGKWICCNCVGRKA